MTELESPSQLSRVEAAKEAELASVPTATGSSPTPNSPLATSDPAPRAKNRFSLNALRLPFSSPRKQGNDKVSPSTDATSSSDSAAMTEQDANRSSTASDVTTAPTSIDQACWKDGTHSQQLSPRSQKNPVRSALTPPADLSRRRASRNVSPHRVSFSPSTEEMADAREQALLHASLADTASAKTKHVKSSSKRNDQHPSKSHTKLSNWHGLKSHSTSALTSTTNGSSLDSAQGSSATKRLEDAAALPGAAAAKRRLFRWDRKGIHHSGASGKGKVVKVKVTKTQAVAARHAKTLEQVINAGMGLHPVPPRLSSAAAADRSIASSDQPANVGKKSKVPRAKPIGVVHQSQLKGLKSALLDVDSANNIIKELRSMPVPLDVLRSGLGSMLSDVEIGTAGDHGQERILTANLPDSVLEGNITKDDSEIRKRPGATLEALDAATPARPPTERRAKSAAEEALRKITLQAEADSASPQKAVVTARTSSLPPSAEDNIAAPTKAASPIPSTSLPKAAAAPSGARPLKMVCLDCDETEAHRRHAQHLEASAVVTEKEASQSDSNGAFNVTSIATGAAAAVTSVGGLLTARPSAVDPTVSSAATDKDRDVSTRPPMLKSMSVSNLPTLQDGARLMGATPLQLILDPVGTAAENSGAFNMLADVSGAAIRATQDMDSIHPPLDRMAIFVHWWGFEITLPKASMAYLDTAHSVSGAFLSFLQTMAVGGGVPELLPFIKYISTFMEVEYRAIRAQDQGHGVCIAGTWFMPMALVPRPWDYPLDGPVSEKLASRVTSPSASMPVPSIPAVSPVLTPPLATPSVAASPTRHVFKKKQATQTTPSAYPAQVALVEAPVRHVSPTQMAAIQAARTEKLPLDLSPRHSRSSSIASAKSAKLSAQLTSASDNAVAPQADAVLSSVQEVPEAGSQIKS